MLCCIVSKQRLQYNLRQGNATGVHSTLIQKYKGETLTLDLSGVTHFNSALLLLVCAASRHQKGAIRWQGVTIEMTQMLEVMGLDGLVKD